MNLATALYYIYPDGGFEVRDDGQGQGPFIARWDRAEPQPTEAEIAAASIAAAKDNAKHRIDAHAGATRDRFVSPGQLIGEEYTRAHGKAVEWLADQTKPTPKPVQSWAEAKGWTAIQAAQDIEATGALWYGLLDQIRDIRLKKKALVDTAVTEAEVQQVVQDAINALDAL